MRSVATALAIFVCWSLPGTTAPQKDGDPKNAPYKSPEEFFKGMPKEAHPRGGEDGAPERAAARDWLKKHRVGKSVEWVGAVEKVTIREIPGRGFVVLVYTPRDGEPNDLAFFWGNPVALGSEKCNVELLIHGALVSRDDVELEYGPVDSAAAKKIRDSKGKKVVFRSTVTKAEVFPLDGEKKEGVLFRVYATNPSIDGYQPPVIKN